MTFPTLAVVDADGVSQTRNTIPDAGQLSNANSLPVVLSSDQQAILSAIVTALSSVAVTGTFWQATQPVSIASSVATQVPNVTTAVIVNVTTSATGANYTAFAAATCTRLSVNNATGTPVQYRRGAAGLAHIIPDGTVGYLITGITNASQIDFKRVDSSNTQVLITAEALT